MCFSEASVGFPHDLLQLPKFAKETRVAVVDALVSILGQRMHVTFDVPNAVGKSTPSSTCDLLLLETPLGKLDLVREENAASHDMHKSELGLDGSKALLRLGSVGLFLDNFDAEEVVRITLESLVSVGRDLVLPVGFSDRSANVVRV